MPNHKNLIVWQKAHNPALNVYKLTDSFPQKETFGIISQIRRAALSVPTNIVEGYGRRTKTELSRFIDIARGSLAETEYLLEFSNGIGYIKASDELEHIRCLITEVEKLLWSFRKNL